MRRQQEVLRAVESLEPKIRMYILEKLREIAAGESSYIGIELPIRPGRFVGIRAGQDTTTLHCCSRYDAVEFDLDVGILERMSGADQ